MWKVSSLWPGGDSPPFDSAHGALGTKPGTHFSTPSKAGNLPHPRRATGPTY